MFPPLLSQAAQKFNPAHVALAPCSHAIAHPMLFARNALGQQGLVPFLFFQHLVAPLFKGHKAALHAPRLAAVNPDGSIGQGFEKTPVMADQDQGTAKGLEFGLQPFDSRKIKMVGGFIQQQHIGITGKRTGQGGASGFAT